MKSFVASENDFFDTIIQPDSGGKGCFCIFWPSKKRDEQLNEGAKVSYDEMTTRRLPKI